MTKLAKTALVAIAPDSTSLALFCHHTQASPQNAAAISPATAATSSTASDASIATNFM